MIEDIFEKSLSEENTIEDILCNYKKIVFRINTLTSAILNIKRYSCLDGATSNLSGMPGKTGYKDCPMESYVCNNDETERNMIIEKEKYEARLLKTDALINTLDTDIKRKIIKDFYIHGLLLQQIADNVSHSLSAVSKSKAKSLIELQKIYDENKLVM